jgi:S-DNA-T family DNA segregation ATPase FtsK/SpoIIIE
MAKNSTRKKTGKPHISRKNQLRNRKVKAILIFFLSMYLITAFTSYLFTWKMDQDKVLQFSWQMMFQENISVENWLGRLGALISNQFFYWGFGLSSFAFAFLLMRYGLKVIKKEPRSTFLKVFNKVVPIALYMSVMLEALFISSAFPWGGAIGEAITIWLSNFIGSFGLYSLLVLIVFIVFVWRSNPEWEDFLVLIRWNKLRPIFSSSNSSSTTGLKHQSLRPSFYSDSNPIIEPEPTDQDIITDNGQLEFQVAPSKAVSKKKTSKNSNIELEGDLDIVFQNSAPSEKVNPQKNTDSNQALSDSEDNIARLEEERLSVEKENAAHDDPYDPTLELSSYRVPGTELLFDYSDQKVEIDRAELEANKDQIITTLLNYKIEITKIRATIGPTVTLYEIVPAPGVRISRSS